MTNKQQYANKMKCDKSVMYIITCRILGDFEMSKQILF